jgi:hypothetical protein
LPLVMVVSLSKQVHSLQSVAALEVTNDGITNQSWRKVLRPFLA